jgi:hypothetical protein
MLHHENKNKTPRLYNSIVNLTEGIKRTNIAPKFVTASMGLYTTVELFDSPNFEVFDKEVTIRYNRSARIQSSPCMRGIWMRKYLGRLSANASKIINSSALCKTGMNVGGLAEEQ